MLEDGGKVASVFLKGKIICSDIGPARCFLPVRCSKSALCLNSIYFTNAGSLSGDIYKHCVEKHI